MIYVASPYTHPDPAVREARFEAVCKFAADLMRRGEVVFSPIAHSHPISLHGLENKGNEFWLRQDRRFMAHSDVVYVLMLAGWKESKGVAEEIRLAEEMGIEVVFVRTDCVFWSDGDAI